MSQTSLPVPPLPESVSTLPDPAEAFARVLPQLEAFSEQQLVAINVDIPATVGLLLANAPRLASLAPAAEAELRTFDVQRFARLQDLALALAHLQAMHMTSAPGVTDDLAALLAVGVELRDRLLGDATYLVGRGIVDGKRVEQVKGLSGYRNVAFDLLALASLFRDAWPVVQGKSAAEQGDLTKAEEVAGRILKALSVREQSSGEAARATMLRHRAYSLLFREYDAIRRVVAFLRWDQDDADSYAPSLFAGRRSARRDKVAPTQPSAPAVPSPSPGAPAPDAAHGVAPVSPALPGGSPFIG